MRTYFSGPPKCGHIWDLKLLLDAHTFGISTKCPDQRGVQIFRGNIYMRLLHWMRKNVPIQHFRESKKGSSVQGGISHWHYVGSRERNNIMIICVCVWWCCDINSKAIYESDFNHRVFDNDLLVLSDACKTILTRRKHVLHTSVFFPPNGFLSEWSLCYQFHVSTAGVKA